MESDCVSKGRNCMRAIILPIVLSATALNAAASASISFIRQEVRYVTPDLEDRQFTDVVPTSRLFAGSRQQSTNGGTIEFSGTARTHATLTSTSLYAEVESTLDANVLVPFDMGDYAVSSRSRALASVFFAVTEPTSVLIQSTSSLVQSGATIFWREEAISPQLWTYNSAGQSLGYSVLGPSTQTSLLPDRTYALLTQSNLWYYRGDFQPNPPASASRELTFTMSVDVIPAPGFGAVLAGLCVLAAGGRDRHKTRGTDM